MTATSVARWVMTDARSRCGADVRNRAARVELLWLSVSVVDLSGRVCTQLEPHGNALDYSCQGCILFEGKLDENYEARFAATTTTKRG